MIVLRDMIITQYCVMWLLGVPHPLFEGDHRWLVNSPGIGLLMRKASLCPDALFDILMTSSNGNFFRVTGPLCGEFAGRRWIPHTRASGAELWCFLDLHLKKRLSKQSRHRWFETPWWSLWRHCNVMVTWLGHQESWYTNPSTCINRKHMLHMMIRKTFGANSMPKANATGF